MSRSKQRVLICGSIAYDTIMVFGDRFREHILPDQTHILNVSFQVAEMRREFGGTAANIAYNLKHLGGEPVVMATLGLDGDSYRQRLEGFGVALDGLRVIDGTYTAQAYIITDLDDNQITAFHPGAMNQSHQNAVADVSDIALGIVAPDGREGMIAHAKQFAAAGIPFVFDPGQGLPLFSGPELLEVVDRATYLTVNDYEGQLVQQKTGLGLERLAERLIRRGGALVVTLGAHGSRIYNPDGLLRIPAVHPRAVVDPTGCGDAYRAGLLYGIVNGWAWQRTGRLASLLGAIKVASRGAQNHTLSRDELSALYFQRFQEPLW
ncbi:MAG: carbohydrate kinase family protein [Betaproteobacteria bacterium]|nr:carbohydrate kinase family protein [Betaproteobacteria bacterium]